jgi:hypothetical protein
MTPSSQKRVVAVVASGLVFVSYLGMRDTIKVTGDIPQKDVRAAVAGLQECSSPKFFRYIEISRGSYGQHYLLAQVREPGHRWSITVFTNCAGAWKKSDWALCAEDRAALDDFIHRANK